ncbi:membrane-bound lytic murein transglycosylase A precursor [mine drainage metagenome]|uniref:peptidoglycan lytic exotransglycosylase n=1 Tax=mine drainage metagenome TaxID=410659 RepID=A0A1J5RX52_9ZZZZ
MMTRPGFYPLLLLLLAGLGLAGCSSGPSLNQGGPATGAMSNGAISLEPVTFQELPGWREDRVLAALPALRRSCRKITAMPEGRQLGLAGAASDWTGPCGALRAVEDEMSARDWAERWLQPYLVTAGGSPEGIFTGYCEAALNGSRQPSARYRYPLYARPAGWPANPARYGERLPSHREIDDGALRGRAHVLLWVDDLVDANILQIQGSGEVRLDDGSVAQVGYDGNNGREWVGLGTILRRHRLIGRHQSNMPAIRAWLKAHPAQAPALMSENPRYIFFRFLNAEGPVGAEGVALTPGRSLAVDPRYIPLGMPLWLDTADPQGRPLRRLMVAQDSGKGIVGVVRGDYFWGPGETAFDQAGRMRSRGRYYLLLPRQRSSPLAWDGQ